jgi:ribonuclease I
MNATISKETVKSSVDEKLKTEKKNGGARPNSGRKRTLITEVRLTMQETMKDHPTEEVEVVVTDKGTGETKLVKSTRIKALLDMLFTKGFKDKDVGAAKEYFDRTIGKAPQAIIHSGSIDTTKQDKELTKGEIAAAEAYKKATS